MTSLKLSLFGSFTTTWQGELVTTFPSDKVRALLVYLAIEGERPLRRDTLATLLWSEWANDKAKRNLRQNLHRLKLVLNTLAPELGEQLLIITRSTIQVNRDHLTLDVAAFQAALTAVESHNHRHLHDCADCMERLIGAADLAHGAFLAGFSLPDTPLFDEWLTIQQEQLHYQSLQLLSALSAAYIQRGDFTKGYNYAARQIALEPWREEAYRQMMVALARQGRRNEALAQYEVCCRVLDEELGVSPTAETVALYTDILHETLSKEATPGVVLHHFPVQFTPFVGRDKEITAVSDLLLNPNGRLLTLLGPGGIGKTRLSLRAVESLIEHEHQSLDVQKLFPDGAYFVPLAETVTGDQLIIAIARAIEFSLPLSGDSEQHLFNYMSSKKLLLILDNFEQLVVNSAVFVAQLLGAAPDVHLLITSREPLHIQPEQKIQLYGLPYPDEIGRDRPLPSPKQYPAMSLFIQTARQQQPHFQPDESNLQAIARICQLTHGTPLALEIAATWVRLIDCQAIAEQIDDSLDFLETALRDAPERHRSIRAVFQQSWEFLGEKEQIGLVQLAVFRGGFSLEAARAVTEVTIFQLNSLLDKSLLQRQRNGRYTLHALIHQFAHEKQTILPEQVASVTTAQSQHFLQWVRSQGVALFGAEAQTVTGHMRQDHANIHFAWQTAVAQKEWSLIQASVASFTYYHMLSGQLADLSAALNEAAEATDEPLLRGYLALYRAHVFLEQGRLPEAAPLLDLASEMADAEQSLALQARTQEETGRLLELQGDYVESLESLQTSLHYYMEQDNPIRQSRITNIMGNVYWRQSLFDQALSHYYRALSITEEIGDNAYRSVIFGNIGIVNVEKSAFDKGIHYYEQALQIDTDLGNRVGIARHTHNIARIYRLQGKLEPAMAYFQKALAIAEEMGVRRGVSLCAINIGVIYKELGDYEQAEVYYLRALRISQQLGLKEGVINSLGNLGNLYREMARFADALDYYEQSLQLAHEIGFQEGVARQLGNVAMVYKAQALWPQALDTFDEAIEILYEIKETYYVSALLIEKGAVLMAQEAYDEARAVTEEGTRLAEQSERRGYALNGRIQLAKIDHATGAVGAAQQQLQSLLDSATDPNERALIQEGLSEIL